MITKERMDIHIFEVNCPMSRIVCFPASQKKNSINTVNEKLSLLLCSTCFHHSNGGQTIQRHQQAHPEANAGLVRKTADVTQYHR